jgi:hypothetical protein
VVELLDGLKDSGTDLMGLTAVVHDMVQGCSKTGEEVLRFEEFLKLFKDVL